MAGSQVDFYFDYISPYAYLAWEQGKRIAASTGASLNPKPVLFAGLLNHHGQKGPAEIPAKRTYLFADVLRKAVVAGIKIDVPAFHPFNPLLPLRVTLAAKGERRTRVVDAIFRATWSESHHVSDAAALESLGLGDLLKEATSDSIKAALKASTASAIEEGVFGVPTFVLNEELFWGVDSLPFLEQRLLGEPAPSAFDDQLLRWEALEASAHRKT